MQPPPEEESEPSQETPEASGALFEEGSPEAEASPACFVSVVGFGAYVVGLRAGEPNQRRRHRGAPETL